MSAFPCNAEAAQIITWAIQVGTWIVLVFGWRYVDHCNELRQRRQERSARMEELRRLAYLLEQTALHYHVAERPNLLQAKQARQIIQRLSIDARRLKLLPTEELTPLIIRVRQAVTARNFDSANFVAQPTDSPLLEEIGAALEAFLEALDTAHAKRARR